MSYQTTPSASASSSNPAKRTRLVKPEEDSDDEIQMYTLPAIPSMQDSPTPPAVMAEGGIQLAQEQDSAVNTIASGCNIFLTGSAGSGKTMVLKKAIAKLRDQGKRVGIAAPTGKVAQAVGGTTLRSLFGLTPKKMERTMNHLYAMAEGNDTLRQRLAHTDALIIDEISMVEKIFLDRLSQLMRAGKGRDVNFGGVQLIVCGYFAQLAPVKSFSYLFRCGNPRRLQPQKERNQERKLTMYRCCQCLDTENEPEQWAFASQALDNAEFVNVNLRQNHRQQEDRFVTILDKVGNGETLNQDERKLLYHHPCNVKGAVYLYPTNREVDEMNNSEFDKPASTQVNYKCVDNFRCNPLHQAYKDFKSVSKDD